MKKEVRIFLSAVMFLTRIRVPATVGHSAEYLQKAPRYFPLVGCIVGVIAGGVFLVFTRFVSVEIGTLASMIASLLVTGAFHEDGFADVCDGMGGGWTREQVLTIMKDSRLGTYGVVGLIAILAFKYMILKELALLVPEGVHAGPLAVLPPEGAHAGPLALLLPKQVPPSPLAFLLPERVPPGPVAFFFRYRFFLLALIAAHGFSRLLPVLVMQFATYAGDPDRSKSVPLTSRKLSPGGLATAIVLAIAPFALLPWTWLLTIPPAMIAAAVMQGYFNRRIGGYTGDCLGAIQQVTEILFYLGFVIIWRYV
jgi:adenosylcobinamide-GDP ribazoletransferase